MTKEELDTLASSEQLTDEHKQNLEKLSPGSFRLHRSWGFGQVKKFDLALGQVIIDFLQKPGHPMQIRYAAESLNPMPPEHLLARIASGAVSAVTGPIEATAVVRGPRERRVRPARDAGGGRAPPRPPRPRRGCPGSPP